ncbi:MAG: ABC transporter permease [Burkholderiaceae bacterium]
MRLLSVFSIALKALAVNLLRSALTMLGIVIGVAAVIAMVAIGRGAQERVQEQIKSLGSNIMLVLPGARNARGLRMTTAESQPLSEEDAIAITNEIAEVQYAAPSIRTGVQVIGGQSNWASTGYGITNDYLLAREWSIDQGRMFTPDEMRRGGKVAIVGQTLASELFGDASPLGQQIRINRTPLAIIGVTAAKGQNSWGSDQDDVVFMPIGTMRERVQARRRGRTGTVGAISLKIHDGQDMSLVEQSVRDLLRQRNRLTRDQAEPFTIRNLTEVMAAREESSKVLTWLLGAVAGVSLLVGGIGIMNIMLVSVTERTREIGLRMAVGARSRDILSQFLVEAVTLSLIGGALGIATGIGVAYLVAHLAGWPVRLSLDAIVLAVGFSGAIGIFFGFYPARAAARLHPIEALRHE